MIPSQLILFFSAYILLLPKHFWRRQQETYSIWIYKQVPYLFIIFFVVFIHLIEINLLDSYCTTFINQDFAIVIEQIENGYVAYLASYWHPVLVTIAVAMYILIYPFLLWFTPLYALLTQNTELLKIFAIGVGIIYSIALPFYLFLPITNVYLYHHLPSALEHILPSIEQFYYTTTGPNNTLPSLHVAISLFIPFITWKTTNKRFFSFSILVAIGVICAVLYLAIHWFIDVIAGVIVTITAIKIVQYLHQEHNLWQKAKNESKKK